MALNLIRKASPTIRLVIVVLSILYVFGVKSFSSMEIGGVKFEIGEIALMPWMFAGAIFLFELMLLLDFLGIENKWSAAEADDEEAHRTDLDRVKDTWVPSTTHERRRADNTTKRGKLETFAFILVYLLPAAAGIYCIINFVVLYVGR